MNIDKYGENSFKFTNLGLDKFEIKQMTYYTKYIGDLNKDSKILEIGPGSGKFLVFLQNFYGLDIKNISSLDASKSIYNNIQGNKLTGCFNNNLGDTIDYLSSSNLKFDLIIMKHVLEHMEKDYIINLIPILLSKLNYNGKLLIEVPNMANLPFGYVGYFSDFSHMTAFTDISLKQAFDWYSNTDISVNTFNLYIYPLNFKNPLTLIKSIFVKIFYYSFCKLLKFVYNFANFNFNVTTTAILGIIIKKK